MKALVDLVSGESYFSLCPHEVKGMRELSRVCLFYKSPNPIHEGVT